MVIVAMAITVNASQTSPFNRESSSSQRHAVRVSRVRTKNTVCHADLLNLHLSRPSCNCIGTLWLARTCHHCVVVVQKQDFLVNLGRISCMHATLHLAPALLGLDTQMHPASILRCTPD
jgi:hypothetical protein